MRKVLLTLTLALLTAPVAVQAQQSAASAPSSIDLSNLPEEKRRAIQTVVGQMTEEKTNVQKVVEAVQSVDSTKVRGWAEAGTEAGKAVGNFTREIGLVAKDFLDTGVGQAIFLLLFMNYGGGEMAQFLFDAVVFALLTPFLVWFMWRIFQRYVLRLQVTYTKTYNKNTLLRWLGVNETTKTVTAVPPWIVKDDRGGETDFSWAISTGAMIGIFLIMVTFFTNLWPMWPAAT